MKIASKNRDLKRLSYNWRPGPRPFKKKKRRKKNMVNDVKKKTSKLEVKETTQPYMGGLHCVKGKRIDCEKRVRKEGVP